MGRLWRFAPVVGVAIVASSAQAGMFRVRDAVGGSNTPGVIFDFYLTGTQSSPSGTNFGSPLVNLPMGAFDFEIDPTGTGNNFEAFNTYCLDPTQAIGFGENPDDDDGVDYGTAALTTIAGLSAQEAGKIEILWSNAFNDSLLNSVNAGAFQIIIWELVRDDSFSLTSGLTRLSTTNAQAIAIASKATEWWNNIIGGTWTTSTPLLALTSPDSQAMILPVPTPGAAVLGMMGVAIAGARRRRGAV